jgi:hypothetical protein
MGTAVVLLHRLPDGSSHFDLLLQRPPPPGLGPSLPTTSPSLLISFRTTIRPDRPPPWSIPAERLPDHRPLYLDFEGPVSGGRGEVQRLARGRCSLTLEDSGRLLALLDWGSGPCSLDARQDSGPLWMLHLHPAEP